MSAWPVEDERIMEVLGEDKNWQKAKLIICVSAHRVNAQGVSCSG